MAAVFSFYSVLNSIVSDISSLIRDTPIMRTLADRLSVFYDGQENDSGKIPAEFRREITARDLSFSYDDKKIFSGVNFSIRSGDKVAVCGENGSGKSTLIKVLSCLLKDYAGQILIDGTELSEISSADWYGKLAFVEQDPYLFSVSVRDNVRLGNLAATEEEVDRVMEETGIGYLSGREITNAYSELSGGERQKIAIARALIKDAPVIVMDEPSNNLDSDTTDRLKDFIRNTSKTVIFVSHDPEVLKCADHTISL